MTEANLVADGSLGDALPLDPHAPSPEAQAFMALVGALMQRTDSPVGEAAKQLAALLKGQVSQGTPLGKAITNFLEALRDPGDPAFEPVHPQTRLQVHGLASTVLMLAKE